MLESIASYEQSLEENNEQNKGGLFQPQNTNLRRNGEQRSMKERLETVQKNYKKTKKASYQ